MRNWRNTVDSIAMTLTEPSWMDLWLIFGMAYVLIMRADSSHDSSWTSVCVHLVTSAFLAVYGATLTMTAGTLLVRGARALDEQVRGADKEPV